MIISDYHTHSSNSGDCNEKMQTQVEAAIKKGLHYLCITEHNDFDYPDVMPGYEDEACDFTLDINAYQSEYNKMYNMFCSGNKSETIDIRFGIELGLQPDIADKNKTLIENHDFDFVIASSHVLDNSDPYYPSFWEGKNESGVFRRYFTSIYENICLFSDFDVYGHLDYIIRYGKNKDENLNFSDYSDEIDTILKKLIDMGKGIEINTGGLRNGLKFPNPNPAILKRYKELSGEIITVGSDAHCRAHIASYFNVAEDILKDCGFKYYTIYKNRKPEFIRI